MSLKIETIVCILDFLRYKNARNGVEFNVVAESTPPKGNTVSLETSVIIQEKIGVGGYELVFMDDFVKPYIGGYVVMSFQYLKNVMFVDGCLKFETSNGYSIVLK